jgi:curved DNA-binding protein
MDHYSTLGVDRNATPEDIKQAFRKLAREHHPDRGGDENKFKQLNEAYTILSDPETKARYDFQGNQQHQFRSHTGGGPFHQTHTFSFGDGFAQFHQNDMFEDMMKNFGFQFNHAQQQPQKNKDLNIRCRISLRDAYIGKSMSINYRLPGSGEEKVDFNIPPGIDNGHIIKLDGYGDNSIRGIPRGDLTISIEVDRDNNFFREELNLITETEIDIFDAMLGCTKSISNIDGNMVDVTIRAGAQHGQRFSCKGMGFKNVRFSNVRGDLHVIVKIKTPIITDTETKILVDRLAERVRRSS